MRGDDDAVLGRTLVETAHLNAAETRARQDARTAVTRSQPAAHGQAGRRRAFRTGMLLIVAVMVLLGLAAVLLRPLLAPPGL